MRFKTWWLLVVWTVLVLYPNPLRFMVSTWRAWAPPVDADAVHALAATLPDDPAAIEHFVHTTLVPYAVPWQTYGVPWYFPTVTEVLASGQGDCQARALVLASLLEAKGIPARFVGSFDHLWIDYPGKRGTGIEDPALALVVQNPAGRYAFHLPKLMDWEASWQIERAYFWDTMPTGRRILLVSGWLGILCFAYTRKRRSPVPAWMSVSTSLYSTQRSEAK